MASTHNSFDSSSHGCFRQSAHGWRGGGLSYACVWVLNTSNGSLIETYDTGENATAVCSDGSSVFVAGDTTIYAFGVQEWTLDLGVHIYGLDIDSSGNLFAGTAKDASNKSLFKITNAGSISISKDCTWGGSNHPDVIKLRVMPNGRVAVTDTGFTSGYVSYAWPSDLSNRTSALGTSGATGCFEYNGNIYSGLAGGVGDRTQAALASIGGNLLFFEGSVAAGEAVGALSIFMNGALWVVGSGNIVKFNGDRFNANGSVAPNWHRACASYAADIDVDVSGSGYVVGALNASYNVACLSASGNLSWSYLAAGGTNACRLHGTRLYVAGARASI